MIYPSFGFPSSLDAVSYTEHNDIHAFIMIFIVSFEASVLIGTHFTNQFLTNLNDSVWIILVRVYCNLMATYNSDVVFFTI